MRYVFFSSLRRALRGRKTNQIIQRDCQASPARAHRHCYNNFYIVHVLRARYPASTDSPPLEHCTSCDTGERVVNYKAIEVQRRCDGSRFRWHIVLHHLDGHRAVEVAGRGNVDVVKTKDVAILNAICWADV
jgi:hypothetical protein